MVNNSNVDVIYQEVAYGNARAANGPTRINSYDSLELPTQVSILFADPPRSISSGGHGRVLGWVHYADDD
ncbi:MAG: hypothetical protein LBL48_09275 [Azoarcus sp.]|jgi:hypothetical protein|nr:hypothetical protein [Azoarcus sp.]